jgi:hypothetical protein
MNCEGGGLAGFQLASSVAMVITNEAPFVFSRVSQAFELFPCRSSVRAVATRDAGSDIGWVRMARPRHTKQYGNPKRYFVIVG